MRKIISYCVWGNCKIYSYNILENALDLPSVFPDWRMIVYYTPSVNKNVINELKKLNYVDLQLIDIPDGARNTMLRFTAGFNPTYDYIIFRDADSRLLKRDYDIVNDWINSGKDIHIIRDHPANGSLYRISAGMWGIKNGFFLRNNIKNHFINFFSDPNNNKWRIDEKFLFTYIYPLVNKNNSIIHSPFKKYEDWDQDFPNYASPRNKGFIGQVNSYTPKASKLLNDNEIKHIKRRS